MTQNHQLACSRRIHPGWVRLLAFTAILLVLLGSFAQAAHVHGDNFPHHDMRAAAVTSASLPAADEAGCPLCIAMHSALAEQDHSLDLRPVAFERHRPALHALIAVSVVHFCLFSRPPPAGLLQPPPTRLA